MKQVRYKLFETNSSSTHSISFRFKKRSTKLQKRLDISGDTCNIYGIYQFEFVNTTVSGAKNKLDYIFTWMYIRDDNRQPIDYWEKKFELSEVDRYDLYWPPEETEIDEELIKVDEEYLKSNYNNILKAIQRKYPEVKKICFKDAWKSDFDHQTGPYEEESIINLDDIDEIYNYIFNDHIIIKVGHD